MDELTKTLCSSNYAKENGVLLYNNDVYIREDTPALALLEVRRVLGCAFVPVTLAPEAFDEMLAKIWQQSSGVSQQLVDDMDADIDLMALTEEIPDNEDLLDNDENSPVIRLINAILGEAVKDGASDIHIETFERTLSIRFRVDGVLRPVLQPARKLAPLLVSRIKVMSKLDIAEKRLPQDGRISLRIGRKAIDVRVSTIPSQYGERVVMRLLDKSNLKPDINKLGLIDEELEKLKGLIDRPHGIILVTGPTGSGKSTTLYAILSALNGHERNILTVEDPIEYELEGVGQTQVNPRVDMTFARGLRAILRQDPDVVMIGEIRDGETAQIAVQASLTGHLVMSTLHTNSAAGAITRLRDMGLESFLIGSSLLGVIAQRLVRRLCTHCRTTSPLDANEKALFSFMAAPPDAIYRAVGCEHCRQSGYQGRAGIHEFLVVDSAMRRAIHEDKDEMSLETQLFKHAYSLRENGLLKVIGGVTSLEEVMRVTAERGGCVMAFYAWTATDAAGKTQRGTLQAEGQKQVRQWLREQKLMPVSITETRETAAGGKAKTGVKLSTPVLSMFTRQLSTLVNAALPLESALKAISKQTEDKKLAAMVVEIREKVVEGHTLFDAFSQFPRTFDKLYCTLVMAGEKTGHLGDVLEKLAEYNEQRQKMKSKLTQAMVYPITLTVVAIAVISILLVAVVPQVIEQFTHMKQQLPITTRTLIAVSDFLQAWGIYIVGILGGGFIGFKTWLRNAKNRFRWHSWLVNGSPIKKLVCAINSARYIRTLSILQASSVPLLEGMYIAMDGIENRYARQVLEQAADTVRQGASLYAALEQAKLFPPTMLYMIASGEESGELGNLMDRAAENQESALQHRITLTLSVFEPALVVSMATIVLFIVLSILQPLLQLNNMVG